MSIPINIPPIPPRAEVALLIDIRDTLDDVKAGLDAQHEILINKLSTLESIFSKVRDLLEQMRWNPRQ